MSVAIPPDYNIQSEQLDPIEAAVRALPNIDLSNWGKFRFAIHTGTDIRSLHFSLRQDGQPSCSVPTAAVDQAYAETGKAHHEIIRALYFMEVSYETVEQQHAQMFSQGQLVFPPYGLFCKAVKDFYFHCGSILDNFGRLIYIFNDPEAAATTTKQERERRRIGWGNVTAMDNNRTPPVRQRNYANKYITGATESNLEGIKNVRNLLTHSWKLPEVKTPTDLSWPETVRTDEDFPWWQEDAQLATNVQNGATAIISILQAVKDDYQFLFTYQSTAFEQLRHDILDFETRYSVEIKNVLRP